MTGGLVEIDASPGVFASPLDAPLVLELWLNQMKPDIGALAIDPFSDAQELPADALQALGYLRSTIHPRRLGPLSWRRHPQLDARDRDDVVAFSRFAYWAIWANALYTDGTTFFDAADTGSWARYLVRAGDLGALMRAAEHQIELPARWRALVT